MYLIVFFGEIYGSREGYYYSIIRNGATTLFKE
jgi:hypothetical protein